MTSGKMDEKAAKRIANARGKKVGRNPPPSLSSQTWLSARLRALPIHYRLPLHPPPPVCSRQVRLTRPFPTTTQDPFAKRAHLAYRNNLEREGSGAVTASGHGRGYGAEGSWRTTAGMGAHQDSWRTK